MMKIILLATALLASVSAFTSSKNIPFGVKPSTRLAMANIAEGVDFDTVAREWRCKWSPDADKASLVSAQKALDSVLADVKAVNGVKRVDRVVCGGCLDFKVVTSLSADEFGAWEEAEFAPEADLLEKLKAIDGVTEVETQTYTLMPL